MHSKREKNRALLNRAIEKYETVDSEEAKLEYINTIISLRRLLDPNDRVLYKDVKQYVEHYLASSFSRGYQYDNVVFEQMTQYLRFFTLEEQKQLYGFIIHKLRQHGLSEQIEKYNQGALRVEIGLLWEQVCHGISLSNRVKAFVLVLLCKTSATPKHFLIFLVCYFLFILICFFPAPIPSFEIISFHSPCNMKGKMLCIASAFEFTLGITDISISALNIRGVLLLSFIKLMGAVPTIVFFKNMLQKKWVSNERNS